MLLFPGIPRLQMMDLFVLTLTEQECFIKKAQFKHYSMTNHCYQGQ